MAWAAPNSPGGRWVARRWSALLRHAAAAQTPAAPWSGRCVISNVGLSQQHLHGSSYPGNAPWPAACGPVDPATGEGCRRRRPLRLRDLHRRPTGPALRRVRGWRGLKLRYAGDVFADLLCPSITPTTTPSRQPTPRLARPTGDRLPANHHDARHAPQSRPASTRHGHLRRAGVGSDHSRIFCIAALATAWTGISGTCCGTSTFRQIQSRFVQCPPSRLRIPLRDEQDNANDLAQTRTSSFRSGFPQRRRPGQRQPELGTGLRACP